MDIDGWEEFLEARMRVMRSARKQGQSETQTVQLVSITSMIQAVGLIARTDQLNEETNDN